MRTKVFELPGKLKVEWDPEAKAIVDTWTTYSVSVEEFREAVLVRGVAYAKAHGGRAWIVDAHTAHGTFSQEIQTLIATEVFPTFVEIGIKYFMSINSANALTKMTVNQYTTQAGPAGLTVLNGSSAEGALTWLLAHP